MKFIADKKLLERSITPVCFGAAGKNADPALDGIYIEADDDGIIFCAYDREKGIRTRLDATVSKKGKIVVDAQKTTAIIRSLPDGNITFESDENMQLVISSNEASFKISGRDASTYPGLPDVKGDTKFTLFQNRLKNIINRTVFSVSNDDTKPTYMGSLFEIDGNEMKVVAIDGFRISVRRETGLSENEDLHVRFILPGKAQTDLLRLMNDSDDVVSVEICKKHIIFTFDNIFYISRLIDGEFLDYNKKFNDEYLTFATFGTSRFIESIERASLIIDDKNRSSLRLKFENGNLNVSSKTLLGAVNDSFPIDMDGDALEIGFNHKLILEALRAIDEEKIYCRLSSALNPIVITPAGAELDGHEKFMYIILPMRILD